MTDDVSRLFPYAATLLGELRAEAVVVLAYGSATGMNGCAPALVLSTDQTAEAGRKNARIIRAVAEALRYAADNLETAAQPHPSVEQLVALQNKLNRLLDTGQLGVALDRDDVAVMSWALGTATAKLLPRRRDRPRPEAEPDEITWTDRSLHQALDMLLAEYIMNNQGALPSKTSVLDLLTWSHARLERSGS